LFSSTEIVYKVTHIPGALTGLLYISVLGIVGTAIAVIVFNRLIKETTAVFASSVTYLIPIVAVAWGVLDGELITWGQGLFMVLILAGIFLINSSAPGRFFNWMFR
jgi:drug/metabolite transporter (DMT)-like permease